MKKKPKARYVKLKPRYLVEFELIEAPGQPCRVYFDTERKARRFVDFPDTDFVLRASLVL